ncbi:hypothetical protein FOA43_001803 [Brettanomyces nanus]|uniref:Uncharacterized protein n=1 Tax=Eeniella nana TaxID=13502 RepID=A0A875S0N8_EENNA|nr:uncharacterized protein FOA43_001803 [Brettanomyces nanus]QPG74473.1 hypothetical protein FOA43_001803 [Brettanomyces nanus]
MSSQLPPLNIDGSPQQISSIGERVRSSIDHGYQLPASSIRTPEITSSTNLRAKRVPLPSNLSQPPDLVSAASSSFSTSTMTMSSSSLSCWEDEINQPNRRHMQTLDETFEVVDKKGIKHSFNEFQIVDDFAKPRDLPEFIADYGPLRFNEAF